MVEAQNSKKNDNKMRQQKTLLKRSWWGLKPRGGRSRNTTQLYAVENEV